MTSFPHDDPRFDFIDDPVPPDPDAAVLDYVMARGHQRLIRRRAMFGGLALAAVALLVSGGAAVAQHQAASPGIAVQPHDDTVVAVALATTIRTTTIDTSTTTPGTTVPLP